jgi:16S rRNA (adenine1518-N6/adenine1519-N6)-dimethyltransferase
MPSPVKPKKHLGQHFLKDQNIAAKIVQLLSGDGSYASALEIGPGTGVLTQFLLNRTEFSTYLIDIDTESIAYLKTHFPQAQDRIVSGDFLQLSLTELFQNQAFALIGNLPYNISSPIFFRMLELRDYVPEAVFMIQKEVAERIAAKHGSKTYGILSVLLQAFYDITYAFTVHEHVFDPPPKVKSAVIRLKRNEVKTLPCSEKLFITLVKTAFNQRRKTLRNALKPMGLLEEFYGDAQLDKRAEQLSVADFIALAQRAQQHQR